MRRQQAAPARLQTSREPEGAVVWRDLLPCRRSIADREGDRLRHARVARGPTRGSFDAAMERRPRRSAATGRRMDVVQHAEQVLAEPERAAQVVGAVAATLQAAQVARGAVDTAGASRRGRASRTASLRADPRRGRRCARDVAAEEGAAGAPTTTSPSRSPNLQRRRDGLHRRAAQRPVAALRNREDVPREQLGRDMAGTATGHLAQLGQGLLERRRLSSVGRNRGRSPRSRPVARHQRGRRRVHGLGSCRIGARA